MSNQVLFLSNDFHSYKEVFKQYINESKINDYFNELENEIMKIKNNITEYNLEISNIIDNIKNTIISYLSNSYNKIKKEINEIIYQTLDIIYEEKFENLTESNFSQIINEKIVNLPTIQILDNNKEIINIIEINTTIKNLNYGFSLKKLGTYDFTFDVYVGGDVNLTSNSMIDYRIIETINGNLGSGKIGINANYSLHEMSVNIDAYANFNEVNYEVYGKNIEKNQNIYYVDKYSSKKDIHIKRKIKSNINNELE